MEKEAEALNWTRMTEGVLTDEGMASAEASGAVGEGTRRID